MACPRGEGIGGGEGGNPAGGGGSEGPRTARALPGSTCRSSRRNRKGRQRLQRSGRAVERERRRCHGAARVLAALAILTRSCPGEGTVHALGSLRRDRMWKVALGG